MRLRRFFERTSQEEQSAPESSVDEGRAKVSLTALAAHPSFVPILSIWGAILLGGVVMVLPDASILNLAGSIGLSALGGFTKIAFAVFAALLGGALGYKIGAIFRNKASEESEEVKEHFSRTRMINPATDLGSSSLDAPIEEEPFAAQDDFDDQFDDEIELTDILEEADRNANAPEAAPRRSRESLVAESESEDAETLPADELLRSKPGKEATGAKQGGTPTQDADKPREFDLAEFADLPGRNAVWVEEPSVELEQASQDEEAAAVAPAPIASIAAPAKSALERLRQRDPEELSLVEMVERFAGALHERQKAERNQGNQADPSKDSALAEALKALSLFNENGFDASALSNPDPEVAYNELNRTERELRAALSKLQNLRGAA